MAISSRVAPEIKLKAVKEYSAGEGSLNRIAAKYGVSRSTLQKWLLNYELFGESGLRHRVQNQHYPEVMKRQAVEAYLSGKCIEAVCKKFRIRSRTQLEQWIVLYNGQKELRSPGGNRKEDWMAVNHYQKRKQAVEYCIEHGKDYKLTAANCDCTYQQVYSWVRIYHAGGLERLSGIRGENQKKLLEIITENKRLKARESELELESLVGRTLQRYRLQRVGTADFSGVRNLPKYEVIQQLHSEQGLPVYKLCKIVGVSRAAYYKWKNRTESSKQSDDEKLASLISEIYQRQHGIPGYRQMRLILERRYGIQCNLKRVYRLMQVLGLRSKCRKKRCRRRKKTLADYIEGNVLNREFTACRQNEKWLTDITELKYKGGHKAYLCAILDLYGRKIVSFSLSRKNDTALVLRTFEQALQLHPGATPLLHSDRGSQYTSHAFCEKMKQAGIRQSMSRPGKCLDNAPMEGFWGILKSEMYYLCHFDEYDQLCEAVAAYIHFYNCERYQKRLDCMTPSEFLAAENK